MILFIIIIRKIITKINNIIKINRIMNRRKKILQHKIFYKKNHDNIDNVVNFNDF